MWVLTVEAGGRTPVYAQIIDRVRAGVREGSLGPGTPLPSVRQLARDLGVNANTVAKAYMLLEREGILHSVPRRGCYVADSASDRAQQSLDERLSRTLDRVLEETEMLGLDRDAVLEALRRKLEADPSPGNQAGGSSR